MDLDRAKNTGETVEMRDEVFRLVAPKEVIRYPSGQLRIMLIDAGAKDNLARCLLQRGATMIRAPYHANLIELAREVDGILIGNGPGDPKDLRPLIEQMRTLL